MEQEAVAIHEGCSSSTKLLLVLENEMLVTRRGKRRAWFFNVFFFWRCLCDSRRSGGYEDQLDFMKIGLAGRKDTGWVALVGTGGTSQALLLLLLLLMQGAAVSCSSWAVLRGASSDASTGYFFFQAALMSSSICIWVSMSFFRAIEVARERNGLRTESGDESYEV